MKIVQSLTCLFLLTFVLVWQSSNALACSCIVVPRGDVYNESDVVVVGRVIDVREGTEKLYAKIKVEQTIKGSNSSSEIIEFVTAIENSMCGYDFKVSEKQITIAANNLENGARSVNNCMMYSLKRADRAERKLAKLKMKKEEEALKLAEVKKAKDAAEALKELKATTASCLVRNQTGTATCDAICPTDTTVISCAQNVGNFSVGDTCTSLSQIFSGSTGADGNPIAQQKDRCKVSATCSFSDQTLSAQAWAVCSRP